MDPSNSGPASPPEPLGAIDKAKFGLECIGLFIALSACLAILFTGCYGPLGWNNEWPLVRALPKTWKKHIYPSRIDDPDDPDDLEGLPKFNEPLKLDNLSPRTSDGTLVAK